MCYKARKLEEAGAVGGIIVDNIADSSSETWPLFAMSGDGKDDVNIPVVFLFTFEAKILIDAATKDPNLNVTLSQLPSGEFIDNGFTFLLLLFIYNTYCRLIFRFVSFVFFFLFGTFNERI